jgi:hypothetical protein
VFNTTNIDFLTSSNTLPAYSNHTYCIYLDATSINEVAIDECSDFPQ